jgi:hypothetical protein
LLDSLLKENFDNMVKLVGVFQGDKIRSKDCKARRFLPLEIETDLTMIMALDDFCLACGPCSKKKHSADVDLFMRNYKGLEKDELSACLIVTWEEVLDVLGKTVNCVGCRRSIESLYYSLRDCCEASMDPLVVTPEGFLSVSREHLSVPSSLAALFCVQAPRLTRLHVDEPIGKKIVARRGGRCPSHTLGQKSPISCSGTWLDTWASMEKECKEEVVLLPFTTIRETLDKYLKKHSFCCECANMVKRAFTLLIEEGKEPARAAGEKTKEDAIAEDGSKLNDDGSVNLFSGISACTKDGHVHVQCDPGFISQLLILAEPELSGLKQERHAKTIEIAQKEVLICIGITLFNRFHKIQQKLKEGEQTCDLLCLVVLLTLRKSLDIAAERKRGVTDLELLCEEFEQADREKERRQARKREKKTKQQQKKKDLKGKDRSSADSVCEKGAGAGADPCSKDLVKDRLGSKELGKERHGSGGLEGDVVSDSDSGLGSGHSGETSPLYSREEGRFEGGIWIKGGSPDLDHETELPDLEPASGTYSGAPGTYSGAPGTYSGCCKLNQSKGAHFHQLPAKPENGSKFCDMKIDGFKAIGRLGDGVNPSLMDLLEEDEEEGEDEEGGISPEEIKQFQSNLPLLNRQREQLREVLREKFAALCTNSVHCCTGDQRTHSH